MESAGDYHKIRVGYTIDEPVGFVDSSRPVAGQVATQRLRFPNPVEWVFCRSRDEYIDTLQGFFILGLPIEIVVPCIRHEMDGPHGQSASSSERSCASPCLSCAMALASAFALAGLLVR